MRYQALLFDLDGTLLDTLVDLHNAVNYTLAAFSLPLRTLDETRRAVGDGVGMLIARSIPEGMEHPKFEEILSSFRAYYKDHSTVLTKPYDGITEALAELSKKGYPIGVVSNKFDSAVKELCHRYFPDTVTVAIGESEGVRRKPAPDSLYAAAKALGVSLADCLYIGDSETDILTAKNAGIDCLSVLWGFRDRETLLAAGGKRFVSAPCDLVSAVTEE